MIEKSGGQQNLVCDSCGDPLGEDFEMDRFRAMIDYAKDEGWSIRQEDGSWRHFCPDCKDMPVGSKLDRQRRLLGLR